MNKYIQIFLWLLLIYAAIAWYGCYRDFEEILKTSTEVTPAMIKAFYETLNTYLVAMLITILLKDK